MKHTSKTHTLATAIQELQTGKHVIGLNAAGAMGKQFKRFINQLASMRKSFQLPHNTPSFPVCLTFNKAAVYQLMKSPGCASVRFYSVINSKQQFTLMIVAVDENGENIIPRHTGGDQLLAKGVDVEGCTGLLDKGQASQPYPVPAGL